jgi:hypothetical protein
MSPKENFIILRYLQLLIEKDVCERVRNKDPLTKRVKGYDAAFEDDIYARVLYCLDHLISGIKFNDTAVKTFWENDELQISIDFDGDGLEVQDDENHFHFIKTIGFKI